MDDPRVKKILDRISIKKYERGQIGTMVQEEPVRYSKYLITIQTNQPKSRIRRKLWEDELAEIITKESVLEFLFIGRRAYDRETGKFKVAEIEDYEDWIDELSKIEDISVFPVPEVGKVKGLVHAHICLTVKHRTIVQIEMDALKNLLERNDFYFSHIKFVRMNQSANFENYIEKDFANF